MAVCKERTRLVLLWLDSVGVYSESLKRLAEYRRNKSEFRHQYKAAVSAQRATEEARAALAGHRAEHGC